MTIDANAAAVRLRDRRAELDELQQLGEQAQATVELDQQSVGRLSRMDSLQQQAMAQAQQRARQRELNMIDAALVRIRDGEYGYCVACGEPIADKRLELDPAAAHCISCAS